MRKSEGQKIPEKEIVKQKFCKNFERGRLLVRRARRCNREDLEQFQFVWVTDRLRFGGCLHWFVGRGQYGEGFKSVKKNAALLHFLAFGPFDHPFGVPRGLAPLAGPPALSEVAGTFSVPFWCQKGTPSGSIPL